VSFDEMMAVSEDKAADVIAFDTALTSLAEIDRSKARRVELRFFAGLSVEDTAKVLEVSPGTVKRDWTLVKA
jgi:RNA polymerase sigma-70 factor (ECF subfamily)